MEPVFVGYFPKHLYPPPTFLSEAGVEEIGSASECISAGPPDWIDLWRHNEWGCYNDPETAWSVVSPDDRANYRLYAYAVYPLEFFDGAAHHMEITPPNATPPSAEYREIGWDPVSRSAKQHFECSPLSCNHMVEHYTVNAYCLVNLHDAQTLAATAEREGCEPGPYVVVKVWRCDAS